MAEKLYVCGIFPLFFVGYSQNNVPLQQIFEINSTIKTD
jgi:hypothetical protein